MTKKTRSSVSSLEVFQTLRWIRKNNFKPVPLHYRSKAALIKDYVSPDYKPPDDSLWSENNYGVGCVTGPMHSGPIDIDLDSKEAVIFAPSYLPPTPATFGRKSKLRSHWFYRCNTPTFPKQAFIDPVTKQTIIEMRGDGGHQTAMPPSIHPDSGEQITWTAQSVEPSADLNVEVPVVDSDDLIRAVRRIMLSVLCVRYLWGPGNHNRATLLLAGTLCNFGWPQEETEKFIEALMDYDGDKDRSRIATVRNTYKRKADGARIEGQGKLAKELNNQALSNMILVLSGSPTVLVLNDYNERFAAGDVAGKFRIAQVNAPPGKMPKFYTQEDWLSLMRTDYSDQRNEKGALISKAKTWLASPERRTFNHVDFLPGLEDTGQTINLWTGWMVEPKKGDCSAWLELLRDVICGGNEEYFNWVLHWFANVVREPRSKARTALVIIGPEGAGKTLLFTYFGKILGNAYVAVTKDEHITGRFNNHLGCVLLLHSEEALWAGDRKHQAITRSLITDNKHIFEPKGVNPFFIDNHIRLAMTSNEQDAAAARADDRRHTVIDMDLRKISDELLGRVLKEMDGDGPSALFWHLTHMKYDPMVPRVTIKNKELLDIKLRTMDSITNWWYDTLLDGILLPDDLRWCSKWQDEEGKAWPPVVSRPALHAAMSISARDQRRGYIPTQAKFASTFDKMVGRTLYHMQKDYIKPVPEEGGPRLDPLINKLSECQISIVDMPSLDVCRKAFERHMGQKIDWSKPRDKDDDRPEY